MLVDKYKEFGLCPPANLPTTQSSFVILSDGRRKSITSPRVVALLPMLPLASTSQKIKLFLEFCEILDSRKDPIVALNLPMFSHRLKWQEHPYVDVARKMKFEDAVTMSFLYSLCVEYWLVMEGRLDQFKKTEGKFKRNDLFQVWYPPGVHLKSFVAQVSEYLSKEFCKHLIRVDIMPETQRLLSLVTNRFNFRFAGYAIKMRFDI